MQASGTRALIAVLATALTIVGCQPVDDLSGRTSAVPRVTEAGEPRLGAPDRGLPDGLADLLARTEPAARQWQDDPRVAEVAISVGSGAGSARWVEATVSYIAPDADRLFTVTVDSSGVSAHRTTFATLDLEPIPEAPMSLLVPFPVSGVAVSALIEAAAPALRDCGVGGRPARVLFSSGAPYGWDGRRWTAEPEWRALVLTSAGGGVTLDPVEATPHPDGCLSPQLT